MRNLFVLKLAVTAVGLLTLTGCGGGSTGGESSSFDGAALAKSKCAACHNLEMPPRTSETEKAPPLFTVTVHLKDWMKGDNPSELRSKFVEFVTDYVRYPDRKKSYCDPKSLKLYGLMPSQKENVTEAEARAIAGYIFDFYDQKRLMEIRKEQRRIARLAPAQQVLEIKDCRMCHLLGAGKLAPSFAEIGKRYLEKGPEGIEKAIREGSRGAWPAYKVPMRAYPDLTPKQLKGIARWILEQGKGEAVLQSGKKEESQK
jgi:cytochrome c